MRDRRRHGRKLAYPALAFVMYRTFLTRAPMDTAAAALFCEPPPPSNGRDAALGSYADAGDQVDEGRQLGAVSQSTVDLGLDGAGAFDTAVLGIEPS